MKIFYLQLQSSRHICPHTSIVDEKISSTILKKLGDGVDLLDEGVNLLGEGVDLLGDGVDLLGDGGDPRSIAGGPSKTTVAQKGDQRLEIRKCDGLTNRLTWVGARDTCVSENIPITYLPKMGYILAKNPKGVSYKLQILHTIKLSRAQKNPQNSFLAVHNSSIGDLVPLSV